MTNESRIEISIDPAKIHGHTFTVNGKRYYVQEMNLYRKKKCNSSKLDNKVYKVTNTLDNMVYVGKTELTLNARWNQHIRDTRNNSSLTVHKHMMKVHKHMRKVGIEKFNIEVIEECPQTTRDEIKIREQYHMDLVDDKLLLNVNNAIKGHTNERSKQNLKNARSISKIGREKTKTASTNSVGLNTIIRRHGEGHSVTGMCAIC